MTMETTVSGEDKLSLKSAFVSLLLTAQRTDTDICLADMHWLTIGNKQDIKKT